MLYPAYFALVNALTAAVIMLRRQALRSHVSAGDASSKPTGLNLWLPDTLQQLCDVCVFVQ